MSDFALKAIETEYNGYKFRSRLEARWAVFFDWLKVRYQYEAQGYDLGNGLRYLPDFYLPDHNLYVEVKGLRSEFTKAYKKWELFAQEIAKQGCATIALFDIPNFAEYIKMPNQYEYNEYGLKLDPIATNTEIILKSESDGYYPGDLNLICPHCSHNGLHLRDVDMQNGGYCERPAAYITFNCENCNNNCTLCFVNHKGPMYVYMSYNKIEDRQLYILSRKNNDDLFDALYAAKTARFEHGQKPLTMQIPSKKPSSQKPSLAEFCRRKRSR